MATGLQTKCMTQIIQGGYPGEDKGIDRGYGDWTNVPLNDSIESGYYYRDSDTMDNGNSSKVVVRIRDSWSGSVDPATNVITVTVSSSIISIDRVDASASAGNTLRDISVRPDYNGNWVWQYLNDPINTSHHIGSNINLGSTTFTLAPNTENGRGTVYYRNHSSGYPEDERYRDEFWMGIQVRNVLPDVPSAPSIGAVTQVAADCTHVDARVAITPTASSATYPNLKTKARYKITGENWSAWTTTLPLRVNNIPENTEVAVQAYSYQGQLVGPTASGTFRSWSKPNPATITVNRQWGSQDQTRVDMTFGYNQADTGNYNETTTYIKVKNGDDDWTDWIALGHGQTGTYVLRSVDQGRIIGIKTYTIGDGLCSNESSYTFTAISQPDAPVYNTPVLVDTGACYNVNIPWVQPSYANYSEGKTYLSYSINGETWSAWIEASNWASGTLTISCVPYDARVRIRAYSVGDNLKGLTSFYRLTIPSQSIDDTPYNGPLFMNQVLCENLMYAVELICQEWYAIKDGEREVYTNDDTKESCDGDEDDPTLHSILSRIYRFFQMLDCLICSGLNDSFNHLKRGALYTAYQSFNNSNYGVFTAPDSVVTEDSNNLVYSFAVKTAIDELVRSVYHYVGDWQYMVYAPSDLANLTNKVSGDKAIVKIGADGTNQTYTYNGSTWTAGELNDFDDFSLVHVEKYSKFTTGYGLEVEIKAGSAWYWYNNNWNSLDANLDDILIDVSETLSQNFVNKADSAELSPYILTVDRNVDGTVTGLPVSQLKTIYFVTEEI